MATRPINVQAQQQQQQRGGVVGEEVKQKKMGSKAEGNNNRRALGDIGNLVTLRENQGKPLVQINRPKTRSFCAQLIANAQAAAENNKKSAVVVNGGPIVKNGAAAAGRRGKVVQKKAVEPKPEAKIVEIRPDTVEEEIVQEHNKPKNERPAILLKKKVQTLTSVLTARSKVACGLTDRPKDLLSDIDAADVDNELAAVEYVEDLYKFYKLTENSSRVHDYMDSQPDINMKMRAILVDWLIEVHNKFELMPETLYLTVHIIDRYLWVKPTQRRELQLLGIGAMLIASKYEEIWAPGVNDFVSISASAYTRAHVLAMEKAILSKLEWTLTLPTPYVFLVRFIKASILPSSDQDEVEKNMVFFLSELGLVNYTTTIMYCPSMIAASAVYAARSTMKRSPLWTETLELHTGYTETQLKECAKLLVNLHTEAGETNAKLKGAFTKYSSSSKGAVALFSPAKDLLA